MKRRWPLALAIVLLPGPVGCARPPRRAGLGQVDPGVKAAGWDQSTPAHRIDAGKLPAPPDLSGPQPVDAYIRRAMLENRRVQAAHHNVEALRHRIPQVMALEDPYVSNTIFPIPRVAPQYSLMGYNPYNMTLAQQFPWVGTLRVRGQVAVKEVDVALAELAAAQLDAVLMVKRAYYDLYSSEKARAILLENRKVLGSSASGPARSSRPVAPSAT